ncbi:MAG: sulfate permease [Rhodospirillaceae bacterium]|nr:sulfate permease [Rhodospirillaceae bacterium]
MPDTRSPKAALAGLRTRIRESLASDLRAAVIVTVMLVPQSLAYAQLAGLPAIHGVYASVAPLVAYALFGSSRVLSVGPVAIISLMTASALATVAVPGTPEYVAAAGLLALVSGLLMVVMGAARLGVIATLLSHPVMVGFVSASGVLIAAGQIRHVFGVGGGGGETLQALVASLIGNIAQTNLSTLAVGAAALAWLAWSRRGLDPLLRRSGLGASAAASISKAAPLVAVGAGIAAVAIFGLDSRGVAVVGHLPAGGLPLTAPPLDAALVAALLPSAALIALVGFVESVSVGQTLAARRRQRVDPDRELSGLGAANVAAAFTGGFPVTGGFARSVVNADAGAETQAAGLLTAAGMLLAAALLTPLLALLPQAVLAATIIVAVLGLVDFGAIRHVYAYSRADFSAMAVTMGVVAGVGVEAGIAAGILVSLLMFLWRTARPHIAVVGLVPGTQHFRNVLRHRVVDSATVLTVRIDMSLYFINARYLEDRVFELALARPQTRHVVLMCSAVNFIDASALDGLVSLMERLRAAGIALHLSEVKGPVMDRLDGTSLIKGLTGRVFLSQYDAFAALDPAAVRDGVVNIDRP